MFEQDARDLASDILNCWEAEKEFALVVSIIQDYLIDQNTAFHGKLESIYARLEELENGTK